MPDVSLNVKVQLQAASALQQVVEKDVAALQRLQAAARQGVTVGATPSAGGSAATARPVTLPRPAPTAPAARALPTVTPRPALTAPRVVGQQPAAPAPGVRAGAAQSRPVGAGDSDAEKQAAALERVARAQAGVAGLQRQAEQSARGQAGALTAVVAAAGAATGAVVAGLGKQAAAGKDAGKATLGEQVAAARRQPRLEGAPRSFLDRSLAEGGTGPSGSLLAQSQAARVEFREQAKRARKVADSSETALGAKDALKSTAQAAPPTRRELIAGARVGAARDLSDALAAKTQRALLAASTGPASLGGQYQAAFAQQERGGLARTREQALTGIDLEQRRSKLVETGGYFDAAEDSARRDVAARERQARERRVASSRAQSALSGPAGGAAVREEARAGLQEETRQARERSLAAGARTDLLGTPLGGLQLRRAAADDARAAGLGEVNRQRQTTAGAQAQAAFTGSKEGADALKKTAQLRRDEARAMGQVRWREAVAEQGRFGASLSYAAEKAKTVGDYARNAFLIRAAEIGGLVAAASPSAMLTLTSSAELLAASLGKELIPAVDEVSLQLQRLSRWVDAADPGAKKGAANFALGSLLALGSIWAGARLVQGGSSLYKGVVAAAGWLGSLGQPSLAAGMSQSGAAPGGVLTTAGAGAAGPGWAATTLGLSSTTVALSALAAAALAAEYALGEWSSGINKANFAQSERIAQELTRREVTESPGYKAVAAERDEAKRQKVASDEYDAALKEFQEKSKRLGEKTPYWLTNAMERLVSPAFGQADVDKYNADRNRALKRLEEAKATYKEFVGDEKGNKVKFQGGPGSVDRQQADELKRAYAGLPQPRITEDIREYDRAVQLKALDPSGPLMTELLEKQLGNLGELIKGVQTLHQDLSQLNLAPFRRGR